MNSFSVICIDDANRPDGIPANKWPKVGEFYTVTLVNKMLIQGGMLGFKLAEINIDDCYPYQFFAAKRFAVPNEGQLWAEQELKRLLQEAREEAMALEPYEAA